MRPIGFSTGALGYGDFEKGLRFLKETNATAIELSALRQDELEPLIQSLDRLELRQFGHISVHLPSSITSGFEQQMLAMLQAFPSDWLLITHPNIISMWSQWNALGPRLCIENMDKRKPIGRTAEDLFGIFRKLPLATFCLDLGHAHQIDPTMGEAVLIIEQFSARLRQLHVSTVNSESKHDTLSLESSSAFSVIAHLIPENIPMILESRLPSLSIAAIQSEMDFARRILDGVETFQLAGD